PAPVVGDDPVAGLQQGWDLLVPGPAAERVPVDQYHRLAGAVILVVDLDVCGVFLSDGDGGHGLPFRWRAWSASRTRGQVPAGLIAAGMARVTLWAVAPRPYSPGRGVRDPRTGILVCGPGRHYAQNRVPGRTSRRQSPRSRWALTSREPDAESARERGPGIGASGAGSA